MDGWEMDTGYDAPDTSADTSTSTVVWDDASGCACTDDDEPSAWVADQIASAESAESQPSSAYGSTNDTGTSSTSPYSSDPYSTGTSSSVDTEVSAIGSTEGSGSAGQSWDDYYAEDAKWRGDWHQYEGDQAASNAGWYADRGYASESASAAEESESSYGSAADDYAEASSYTSSSSSDTSSGSTSSSSSTTDS